MQNESETPSSEAAARNTEADINREIKQEPDYHLGDDSDVICLGEKSNIVDLSSETTIPTQELFLQLNGEGEDNSTQNTTLRENLITVQTQPSSGVSMNSVFNKMVLFTCGHKFNFFFLFLFG